MALYNYMDIPTRIIYLDNTTSDKTTDLILPEGVEEASIWLLLLYRPGHYDLIYRD